MSDAQPRADTGDGDADPAPLPHAFLSETSIDPATVVATPADATFDGPPAAPAQDTGKEQAAISSPIGDDDAEAEARVADSATPHDAPLPALDALPPAPESPPPQVPVPDQAMPLGHPSSDDNRADEQADDGKEPAADAPLVVSPIFSALDAAERAAESAQRNQAPPERPADDTGILIPLSQLRDEEADSNSLAFPHLPQEPDVDVSPPPSDDPVAIDVHVGSEAPPHEAAAPPHAQEQPPLSGTPPDDTSARIAAEASATAMALENLKRLLEQKTAAPSFTAPPNPHSEDAANPLPPPIPAFRPAIQLPVMPPPMVPAPASVTSLTFADQEDPPPRRRAVAVGSFLAGFALSWVFGAVLYVYLTAG